MSDERIALVEKELALMQATVQPLVAQMKQSTDAMTKLTNEISLLVQSNNFMQKAFDETKAIILSDSKRIMDLEKAEEVRKSSDAVILWVKRTVVVGLVVAVLSLVLMK